MRAQHGFPANGEVKAHSCAVNSSGERFGITFYIAGQESQSSFFILLCIFNRRHVAFDSNASNLQSPILIILINYFDVGSAKAITTDDGSPASWYGQSVFALGVFKDFLKAIDIRYE